jgi:phytoene dehydrogenase-like protein
MPRSSFYDVIIFGNDPAGIMAGALLSRNNYRVLLIGQGSPGVSYSHDGVELPPFPTMLPPYGHAPILDQVLNTLGVEDPVHTLGSDDDAPLQLVTPEIRLDLSRDREILESELSRARIAYKSKILNIFDSLCADEEQYRQMLDRHPPIQPDSLKERSRLKRLMRSSQAVKTPELSGWPPLLRVLASASAFLSNLDQPVRSARSTGHLVLALLGGLRTVPTFVDTLLGAFKKSGGDLELKTVVEEVVIDGKNATGVRTLRKSNTYNCGALVANLPIGDVLELIPMRRRHRRFLLAANSVRPARSQFMVNLVLPRDGLPMGMKPHLLMIRSLDEPFEEDNLIRVQCLPFPARKHRVLVSFSCIVPYRKRSLGREFLGPLQKRILEAGAWLIPFLEKHLEGHSSPFWEARVGDEGHPSPWSIHQLYETEQEVSLGAAILPLRTPWRNMFYCGPESVPGLGQEGAAYAAYETTRLVTEKRKLKKML